MFDSIQFSDEVVMPHFRQESLALLLVGIMLKV